MVETLENHGFQPLKIRASVERTAHRRELSPSNNNKYHQQETIITSVFVKHRSQEIIFLEPLGHQQ